MSNVLGNLFGEIANAIREKTGGTGTMKPAEFPAEIASIVTGGGGNAGGELKYTRGSFNATSTAMTINHNLGYIPDIMIVVYGNVPKAKQFIFGIGYSSAMLAALGGGWLNIAQGSSENGSVQYTADVGVEADDPGFYYAKWGGGIRSMTTTSFVIGGGTEVALVPDNNYTWFAIGGITG